MSASFKKRRTFKLLFGSFGFCMVVVTSLVAPINVYGQVPGKVRSLDVEFVPEPGCPVAVTNGRAELDLDPFDMPIDARIYIDYKNISERAISAVKFRLRICDAENNDRGTWHASDMELLAPGGSGTEKWKHERIDPRSICLKVRILQVKYQDNSGWMSSKMAELTNARSGATSSGGGSIPVQKPSGTNLIIPDIPAQQDAPIVTPPPEGQKAPPGDDPFNAGN